jgi:hypothetical protein
MLTGFAVYSLQETSLLISLKRTQNDGYNSSPVGSR